MSNISALIDVFKMEEVKPQTRAKIIVKLGQAINYEFGSNVCEPVVIELVRLLDPANAIFGQEHYKRFIEDGV